MLYSDIFPWPEKVSRIISVLFFADNILAILLVTVVTETTVASVEKFLWIKFSNKTAKSTKFWGHEKYLAIRYLYYAGMMCLLRHTQSHNLPYSRKIWREIKFGALAIWFEIVNIKSVNINYWS